MEPFTIILLMLFTFTGTGVVGTQYKRVKKKRRATMRQNLTIKFPVPGRYISLFDLFWDIGVSEFALEIMASQSLLPTEKSSARIIHANIHERVTEHGSYEALVQDLLDAIQEVYREHMQAGHRRQLPTLAIKTQKLLPAPTQETTSTALVKHDGLPDGYLLDIDFQARAHMREHRNFGDMGLMIHDSDHVDIDQLVKVTPGSLLKSLFNGNLKQSAIKWFEMSQLRQHRRELDEALSKLFQYFDRHAQQDPEFVKPLFDLHHRWATESNRIEYLESLRPWRDRPWALAADILLEEARIMANLLKRHAYQNAENALKTLRQYAQKGDLPMAGYLIYLNHYAFLANARDDYSALIRDVDFATARIQSELGTLRSKNLI